MKLKFLIDEDFVNYKKPAIFLGFPTCTFKCNKENGRDVCQNIQLINSPNINISVEEIYNRYIHNPITKAIVCGGLEPLDSIEDLKELFYYFHEVKSCFDDIVIYTGYTKPEARKILSEMADKWGIFKNTIIKYGRFIPDQQQHFDPFLGVYLQSDNQYAEPVYTRGVEFQQMKITRNTNKEEADKIQSAIKNNDGFCICKIEHLEKNRCICQDFLTQKEGWCDCGLYLKEFDK